ncbi:MAG: Stk1 family PASTA domain-containing Ser/Thr kinase [Dermatophilaceae bacterium]
MTTRVPQLLGGRYEVGELIGRGGMAEVHLGYDTRLGRDVAIKILRSDHLRDATFLGRFRREAQSVAGLSHPAIVAVYDSGEERARESGGAPVSIPYIVMEYVDGMTLREILRERGSLTPHEAGRITEGVLGALDYSHRARMVHRDIKPANVMISRDGSVKVMDFGIARAVADSQATMTQTSSVMGTAQYISPEQAEGQTVDSRSDLYSTGCLLFELLTGRTPFVGEPVSLTYQHVTKPPPLPSSIDSAVPDDMDAIVLHALAKNRDLRYQDAESFRADLQAARLGLPISDAARHALVAAQRGESPVSVTPPVVATAPEGLSAGGAQRHTTSWEVRDAYAEPRRSRRGMAIVGVLLVAALALLGVVGKAYLDSRPKKVEVPVVLDLPYATAKAKVELAGFDVAPTYEASREIDRDHVIKQDPAGNTSQREGSLITLTVSTGPASTRVPNLAGKSQATARQLLADVGLNIGKIIKIDSRAQKAGRVISTNPAAFADAFEGDTVDLTVASGWIDLPEVVGKTEDEATNLLRGLDLTVTRTTELSTETEGTVIRQDPEPGKVAAQSTVALVIAKPYPVTTTTTVTTTPSSSSSSSTTTTTTSTSTATLTSPPRSPAGARVTHASPSGGGGSASAPVALGAAGALGLAVAGLWPVAGRRRRGPRRH